MILLPLVNPLSATLQFSNDKEPIKLESLCSHTIPLVASIPISQSTNLKSPPENFTPQGIFTGGTIGVNRIAGELKANHDHIINHKRVQRLMNEMNIKSKIRVKKYFNSKKDAQSDWVHPNLLNRDFDASLPNRKWVTDISKITVEEDKFYGSAIMDLCNREIIAFRISDSPNAALLEATVKKARK